MGADAIILSLSYSFYILASILLIHTGFWVGVFWVEVLNWVFGVGFLVDRVWACIVGASLFGGWCSFYKHKIINLLIKIMWW